MSQDNKQGRAKCAENTNTSDHALEKGQSTHDTVYTKHNPQTVPN